MNQWKEKSQSDIGPFEALLKDSDKSANTPESATMRLSTQEKSMENLEKSGSAKSSRSSKRKTPPLPCLTYLMVTKLFPKVMLSVCTFVIEPTERICWVEMLMSKWPCIQLWVFWRMLTQCMSDTYTELMGKALLMKPWKNTDNFAEVWMDIWRSSMECWAKRSLCAASNLFGLISLWLISSKHWISWNPSFSITIQIWLLTKKEFGRFHNWKTTSNQKDSLKSHATTQSLNGDDKALRYHWVMIYEVFMFLKSQSNLEMKSK